MSRNEATAPRSAGGVFVGALVRFEDRAWQVTGLVGGRVHLTAADGATGCVMAAHLVAADGFEVVGRAAPQIPPATVGAALPVREPPVAAGWAGCSGKHRRRTGGRDTPRRRETQPRQSPDSVTSWTRSPA
ncbi:hypothetical protein [Streptomyces californicus]|uniref:hypothetical protein n=1 Tax=Streptomyces californicus TaxID=67351 RepID=UPI0037B4B488